MSMRALLKETNSEIYDMKSVWGKNIWFPCIITHLDETWHKGQRISFALRMFYTQKTGHDPVEWPYAPALVAALRGLRHLNKTAQDIRR